MGRAGLSSSWPPDSTRRAGPRVGLTGRRVTSPPRLFAAVVVATLVVALLYGRSQPRLGVKAIPPSPRLGVSQVVDINDVGDPYVIGIPPATKAGPPRYLRVGTTDWESNVPAATSTDLTHWAQIPDVLPVLPSWAAPTVSMTWAPAVLHSAVGWVLYYSTEERSSGLECIGRATAGQPTGPYRDASRSPLVCQRSVGGSIDPSVVTSRQGRYLVWKNDGNSARLADNIWVQRLAPSGLQMAGSPHRLLSTDELWQRGVIEAPAMLSATHGGWWLFYSGGSWDSNAYATGLAYCTGIEGPCRETATKPFLRNASSQLSPGGLDTFTDSHGRLWAAFTTLVAMPSRWHPGRVYYNRVLDIAPIISH